MNRKKKLIKSANKKNANVEKEKFNLPYKYDTKPVFYINDQ